MCRWITLLSTNSVSLSDIILSPTNSLIQLSKDASYHPEFGDMNNHVTNGDGFGIGWYHSNSISTTSNGSSSSSSNGQDIHNKDISNNNNTNEQQRSVAVFKDTQPAWNNQNLRELCYAVHSDCMIAHVRAASVFAGISQQNCHPFKAGCRLLFCHNGRIGNFDIVRRQFHNLLNDEAYSHLKGTTDSETLFALLCTYLAEDGHSPTISPYHQTEPFGHERLTSAVKKVLKSIEHILSNNTPPLVDSNFSTLNFSITDGETVVVTRFCDKSPNVPPPSLYFAFGDACKLHSELTTEEHDATLHPVLNHQTSSSNNDSKDEEPVSENGVSDNVSEYDEKHVSVDTYESKPGTIYGDIDKQNASFIVASNPLTKTHTWHAMPKNSIMWYQRGSLPELRLLRPSHLRSKTRAISYVLSDSWKLTDKQQHGN